VRGILVLALYLSASAASGFFYVKVVRSLEEKAIEMVEQAKKQQGGVTDDAASLPTDITQVPAYDQLVRTFAGDDKAKAELWATTPPIVLVSYWLALFFLPFMLMLASHDVLARDNELRTLRFVRPRTSAVAWVVGKFAAQTLLVFAASIASGVVVYAVAVSMLDTFDPIKGGLAFLNFWWRILPYEMGIMGVLFIVSAGTRTAFTALLMSGFTLFALWLLQWFSGIGYLSPFMYKDALWLPASLTLLEAVGAYVAFALAGIGISVAWVQGREI
jgi:hypothetical protein